MRLSLFALVVLVAAPAALAQPSYPQSAEEAVRAVIVELFDGMRAGDSTMVRSVFHPDARMHSSFIREGSPQLAGGNSADGFIEAVGTPHDQVWNEQIGEIHVLVNDGLASAWMDYTFYLGETLSHCGVNSVQLVNTDDGWKMLNLVDTRRRDCE